MRNREIVTLAALLLALASFGCTSDLSITMQGLSWKTTGGDACIGCDVTDDGEKSEYASGPLSEQTAGVIGAAIETADEDEDESGG